MNRTNVIRAASVGKECLNAALALAMSGLPVFPCTATKAPACPGGFKTATCAPDAVLEIFTRYPSPLIGVRTGSDSRLSVLDLDAKHPEARAWWSEHRSCLPVTRAHRTRSGGLHLLYEHCSGVKCTAGKIAPGVDTRGEGGYIIWWPAAGWPVLTESPLAPWPKSLLKRYETQAGGRASRTVAVPDDLSLAGLVRTVVNAPKGQRNCTLFWASCRLGEMVRAKLIDEATALAILSDAGVRAGLSLAEADRTTLSGFRANGEQ
jgi:hypothetical protein